jgi:hypothetical protein
VCDLPTSIGGPGPRWAVVLKKKRKKVLIYDKLEENNQNFKIILIFILTLIKKRENVWFQKKP